MTINGVQGGIGNMSRGVVIVCLSRGVRRHINRSFVQGEWNNIEDCLGGVGQNLSRGHLRLSLGGRGII